MKATSRRAADRLSPTGKALRGDAQGAASAGSSIKTRYRFVAIPLLILLSCLAYINAGHQQFFFDSAGDRIVNERNAAGFAAAISSYLRGQWNPDSAISYLTFPLNVSINRLLGRPPFEVTSFLIFNVIVHALNVVLVYLLVRAFLQQSSGCGPNATRNDWIAFACALLFAVHPIHASSVVYTVQRRGEMATLFYILAVLAWLKVRPASPPLIKKALGDTPPLNKGGLGRVWTVRRVLGLAAVALFAWLSFRSKNMALTLPVTLLAVEFCLRAADRPALRRYLVWLLVGLAASAVAMLVFLSRGGWFDWSRFRIVRFDPVEWGPWTHFLTEARVFVHYWKLLLLPLPGWSCIDHDVALSHALLEHGAIIAIVFHIALLAAAIWGAIRGYTLAAAGILWFYAALLPYAPLPEADLMVEYKTYLPSIGIFLIFAEVLRRVQPRVAVRTQAGIVAAIALILLGTTLSRNRIYRTPLSLWADAAAKSPNKARPHHNFAKELADAGRLDEAVVEYRRALQLDPRMPLIYNNFALLQIRLKQWDEAARNLREAVRLEPTFADAHNNLGLVLAELGQRDEAIAEHRKAAELEPTNYNARRNLVLTLIEAGRFDEAEAEGVKLASDPVDGRCRFAALLADNAHPDQAIAEYRKALQLRPDDANAAKQLAALLLEQSRPDEAADCLQRLVATRPDAEAYYNLGNARFVQGKTDDAIGCYQQAVRLAPQFAGAYTNLGYALSLAGRTEEARAAVDTALRIDPKHPRAQMLRQQLMTQPAGGR